MIRLTDIQFLSILFFSLILTSCAPTEEDLIGTWKGQDQNTSEIGYLNMDEDGYAYFIIKGDTLGGKSFKIESFPQVLYMKYKVSFNTTPKEIDFIVYSKETDNEIDRIQGIFKFSGKDQLVLGADFDNEARASKFKKGELMVFDRI